MVSDSNTNLKSPTNIEVDNGKDNNLLNMKFNSEVKVLSDGLSSPANLNDERNPLNMH
jgi:hypothetical protein